MVWWPSSSDGSTASAQTPPPSADPGLLERLMGRPPTGTDGAACTPAAADSLADSLAGLLPMTAAAAQPPAETGAPWPPQQPLTPQPGELGATLFFARVPPAVTHEAILALFERFGPVVLLSLYRPWATAKTSKGCGLVEFATSASAAAAMATLHQRYHWTGGQTTMVCEPADPRRQRKARGDLEGTFEAKQPLNAGNRARRVRTRPVARVLHGHPHDAMHAMHAGAGGTFAYHPAFASSGVAAPALLPHLPAPCFSGGHHRSELQAALLGGHAYTHLAPPHPSLAHSLQQQQLQAGAVGAAAACAPPPAPVSPAPFPGLYHGGSLGSASIDLCTLGLAHPAAAAAAAAAAASAAAVNHALARSSSTGGSCNLVHQAAPDQVPPWLGGSLGHAVGGSAAAAAAGTACNLHMCRSMPDIRQLCDVTGGAACLPQMAAAAAAAAAPSAMPGLHVGGLSSNSAPLPMLAAAASRSPDGAAAYNTHLTSLLCAPGFW